MRKKDDHKEDDYKEDDYEDDFDVREWLLSKIPGRKTYVSLRARVKTLLGYYRTAKAVLVGIPRYLRSNKKYVAKYSALYLSLWAAEWSLDLQVEFIILGGWAFCLVVDFCVRFLRPLRLASPLSILKRTALLKKKAFKKQKPSFVVWSTFYVGARRFLANPSSRIAKNKASSLFRYLWLAAFLNAFFEFILCPPLLVWLGYVPPTYPDHERLVELMASGVFIDNGLDWTQSHVINWLLSLAAFIALISQTAMIEGRSLSPYVRTSLRKLLVTFAAALLLEVLRVSTLDFVLINQLNADPNHVMVTYIFLPSL